MSETVPFTEAKAHLSELVDGVLRERERIYITRKGEPAAVLINPDELESLDETIGILQDRKLLESLRRSRRESAAGKHLRLKDQL